MTLTLLDLVSLVCFRDDDGVDEDMLAGHCTLLTG